MDCLILAAGLGTRLRPITDTIPKPLIPVAGKGTLFHTLDALPSSVTRIVVVVGYLQERIREAVGDTWNGRPVMYLEQKALNGTGGALRAAQSVITSDRFLVLNGDDLYSAEDLKKLCGLDRGILYLEKVLTKDADTWLMHSDRVVGIATSHPGDLAKVNVGAYLLGTEWFETAPVLVPNKETEWSLPHAIPQLVHDYEYTGLAATFWYPCGTVEEIAEAEKALAHSSLANS